MSSIKKSTRAKRKNNANVKLASLFKMSREQLEARKITGGGIHQTDSRHAPRVIQKRRALEDQLD